MQSAAMIGIYPREFWELEMYELMNALEGWKKAEMARWERVRYAAFYNVVGYQPPGFKPDDIILPIDAERNKNFTTHGRVEQLDKEDLKAAWKSAGLILPEEHLRRIYGDSSKT